MRKRTLDYDVQGNLQGIKYIKLTQNKNSEIVIRCHVLYSRISEISSRWISRNYQYHPPVHVFNDSPTVF